MGLPGSGNQGNEEYSRNKTKTDLQSLREGDRALVADLVASQPKLLHCLVDLSVQTGKKGGLPECSENNAECSEKQEKT